MGCPKWGGGGHFWVSNGFESGFVGRHIFGFWTMIYDVFRVTQLQRLPPRSESWTSAQMELPPTLHTTLYSLHSSPTTRHQYPSATFTLRAPLLSLIPIFSDSSIAFLVFWLRSFFILPAIPVAPQCTSMDGPGGLQQSFQPPSATLPHFPHYILHSTLYTLHFPIYTPYLTPLYAVHTTFYTLHFTLYTLHSTLHTLHCTLYTLPPPPGISTHLQPSPCGLLCPHSNLF